MRSAAVCVEQVVVVNGDVKYQNKNKLKRRHEFFFSFVKCANESKEVFPHIQCVIYIAFHLRLIPL